MLRHSRRALLVLLGSGLAIAQPGIQMVADGATYQPVDLVPGAVVSIFGSGLATESYAASVLPLPTELGGTRVLVDGVAAPLFFVSPEQINFQAPWTSKRYLEKVPVRIENALGRRTVDARVVYNSPRIFQTQAEGQAVAAAVHGRSGELVTPSNPATQGETVLLFATGFGGTVIDPPSGAPQPVSSQSLSVRVELGGLRISPSYAGLAPGLVGVNQINFEIPANGSPGDTTPVTLSGLSGGPANVVGLAIRASSGSVSAPALASLMTSAQATTGNLELTGWVGLDSIPAADTSVALNSDSSFVSVPEQVTVRAGRMWSSFPIVVAAPAADTRCAIRATDVSSSRTALLQLHPALRSVPASVLVGRNLLVRGRYANNISTIDVAIDLTPLDDRHRALIQTDKFVYGTSVASFEGTTLTVSGIGGNRNQVPGNQWSVVTASELSLTITGTRVTGTLALTIRTAAPLGLAVGYSTIKGTITGSLQ